MMWQRTRFVTCASLLTKEGMFSRPFYLRHQLLPSYHPPLEPPAPVSAKKMCPSDWWKLMLIDTTNDDPSFGPGTVEQANGL